MTLVLASSSPIRRQMLEQAGVQFIAEPSDIDEAAQKKLHVSPGGIASALAEAKAVAVSLRRQDALVIGSDSVVSVGARMFDKPIDRDEAGRHLRLFSGQTMVLTSAVALARRGRVEWSLCDEATLRVRPLSDAFIQSYLDAEWPDVGYCVGVFRLEGRGVQLFDSIEGSFFTMLGMPLLPLLEQLRERRVLPS